MEWDDAKTGIESTGKKYTCSTSRKSFKINKETQKFIY